QVARPHAPDDGVEVGPVAVEVGARRVGQAGDLDDVAFEQAAGVGIGHHDGGDIRAELGFEVGEVHPAVVGLGDLAHLVADEGGGGRIGAVGAGGHQH